MSVASEVDPERMVTSHNKVRSAVGVGPLRWAPRLARSAANWANHLALEAGCVMAHSGLGENIYWASPQMWSDGRRELQQIGEDDVVSSWAGERAFYDYERNSCRHDKECGHYTQLVWRDTKEVGCAKSLCPDQSQIWVCHYRPFGNLVGQEPY